MPSIRNSTLAPFISSVALFSALASFSSCSSEVEGKLEPEASPAAAEQPQVGSIAKAKDGASAPSAAEISAAPIDSVFAMMSDVIQETKQVLIGVKDLPSAQAAVPALEEIATRAKAIGMQKTKLMAADASPMDKLKYGKLALNMGDKLLDLGKQSERLAAIPGAPEALDQVMQRILGMLDNN